MRNKVLSFYDWFLIAGVIISNVIYSVLTGTLDVMGSVALTNRGAMRFHSPFCLPKPTILVVLPPTSMPMTMPVAIILYNLSECSVHDMDKYTTESGKMQGASQDQGKERKIYEKVI